jgi:hypothetical protein
MNVCIAIRDMSPDKNNPFTPDEVKDNIEKALDDLIAQQRVKVVILPDIESINYGRGVGYDIIEHVPPKNIGEISATKIRESLKK